MTGRGAGEQTVAIVFTDIVGFSSFVLERWDDLRVELLRAIEDVVAPAVKHGGGRVVKHLGDGHMAVFADATRALNAALDLQRAAGASTSAVPTRACASAFTWGARAGSATTSSAPT
ncbi:MAG: adenylate/guanylate cyclase domain-containing protein [Solirubrobacteraceae bacterium]